MHRIFWFILLCYSTSVFCADTWYAFPLANYEQKVDYWLDPTSSNYHKPLLDFKYQTQRFNQLKARYFGTAANDPSPWNTKYITSLLQESSSIFKAESGFLSTFDNTKITDPSQLNYATNKLLLPTYWITEITTNIHLGQFSKPDYSKNNRAIAVDNIAVRILPTDDPAYNDEKIAGNGYPFDNLQASVIYPGTPLYIAGTTIDGKWLFVISPDVAGWVHAAGVAIATEDFIQHWQSAIALAMVGITQNNIGVRDETQRHLFNGYVGTILPAIPTATLGDNTLVALVPVKNNSQIAEIRQVRLSATQASILPIHATIANFARILKVMQLRQYGWGNSGLYNDCSSELKNIFALFGIYMQRNTKSMDNAGKMTDLSPLSMQHRMAYLQKNAAPLFTVIHINGHVMLYVDKYTKSYKVDTTDTSKNAYPLVYQQAWGLSNAKRTYRAIIGQSVFLPLLDSYVENAELRSEAKSSMFRLIDLTHEPDPDYRPNLQELLY